MKNFNSLTVLILFLSQSIVSAQNPISLKVKGYAEIDSGLLVRTGNHLNYGFDTGDYGFLSKDNVGNYNCPSGVDCGFLLDKAAIKALGDISATGSIVANDFIAHSDSRIKKNVQPTNQLISREMISKVRIVDYQYIDSVFHPKSVKKGVIAQELEKIFPDAVSISKKYIPSIYQLSNHVLFNGDTLSISISQGHDLVVGDRVRLYSELGESDLPIIEVQPGFFKVKGWKSGEVAKLFVYGKEVNDFHAVDYDMLFALNISVTQSLMKELQEQDERLNAMEIENKQMKTMLERLQKQFSEFSQTSSLDKK